MKEKKRRLGCSSIILWSVLLLLVLLIVLMVVMKPPPAENGSQKEVPIPVKTIQIEPRRMPDQIAIPGRIAAYVHAQLATEQAGRIVAINADKGDSVVEGQTLLRIDDRLWQTARKRALVQIEDARKDEERLLNLKKTGAVSVSDYDDIRKAKELAEAAVEEADVMISKCTVRSPIRGTIDDRYVEEGEYATEGMPVFDIVSIDPVKIQVDVPERDVFAVQRDKQVGFEVTALSDMSFTGTVTFVAPTADLESNTFRVELTTDNTQQLLRPGMITEVALVRRIREDAIVVPLAAIVPKKGEHVVFVVSGDNVERRVVRIDNITAHEAVLDGGIEPGEQVVIEGQRSLVDGALVEIVD